MAFLEDVMRPSYFSVLGTLFAFDHLLTENLTEFNLVNGITDANSNCDPNSPLIPCAFLPDELVECKLKIVNVL